MGKNGKKMGTLPYYCWDVDSIGQRPQFQISQFHQFQAYDWPGNVRELKNHITRLRAAYPHAVLSASHAMPFAEDDSGEPVRAPDWPIDTVLRSHVLRVYEIAGRNLSETA